MSFKTLHRNRFLLCERIEQQVDLPSQSKTESIFTIKIAVMIAASSLDSSSEQLSISSSHFFMVVLLISSFLSLATQATAHWYGRVFILLASTSFLAKHGLQSINTSQPTELHFLWFACLVLMVCGAVTGLVYTNLVKLLKHMMNSLNSVTHATEYWHGGYIVVFFVALFLWKRHLQGDDAARAADLFVVWFTTLLGGWDVVIGLLCAMFVKLQKNPFSRHSQ